MPVFGSRFPSDASVTLSGDDLNKLENMIVRLQNECRVEAQIAESLRSKLQNDKETARKCRDRLSELVEGLGQFKGHLKSRARVNGEEDERIKRICQVRATKKRDLEFRRAAAAQQNDMVTPSPPAKRTFCPAAAACNADTTKANVDTSVPSTTAGVAGSKTTCANVSNKSTTVHLGPQFMMTTPAAVSPELQPVHLGAQLDEPQDEVNSEVIAAPAPVEGDMNVVHAGEDDVVQEQSVSVDPIIEDTLGSEDGEAQH
eukprot:g11949.t1